MLNPKQNLLDKRFGRLSVTNILTVDTTPKRNHTWVTKCDCGNEKITNSYCLKYKKTTSCGCYQREMFLKSSVKHSDNFAMNAIVYDYKTGAKKRNLEFKLTHEEFKIMSQQDCHYCGSLPSCVKETLSSKNKHSFTYNGLDRIDNSKGYTMDNIVTCCKFCNVAKHDMTYVDFLKWVKVLSNNLKEKKLI